MTTTDIRRLRLAWHHGRRRRDYLSLQATTTPLAADGDPNALANLIVAAIEECLPRDAGPDGHSALLLETGRRSTGSQSNTRRTPPASPRGIRSSTSCSTSTASAGTTSPASSATPDHAGGSPPRHGRRASRRASSRRSPTHSQESLPARPTRTVGIPPRLRHPPTPAPASPRDVPDSRRRARSGASPGHLSNRAPAAPSSGPGSLGVSSIPMPLICTGHGHLSPTTSLTAIRRGLDSVASTRSSPRSTATSSSAHPT